MIPDLMVIMHATARKSPARYNLRLPVIFHWNDGIEHTEGGFTRDVGIDGALILCTHCPPLGSTIKVEVLVPSPNQDNEELWIGGVGKVTGITGGTGCAVFGVRGVFDEIHAA